MTSDSAVSSPLGHSKHFTLSPPGRPVHSDSNSTSLGSIPATLLTARTQFIHNFTFPPLSIARYSFIQLSELGHRGENGNDQSSKRQQRVYTQHRSRNSFFLVVGRFFGISDKSCKILFSEFYQIMPCIMFSDN